MSDADVLNTILGNDSGGDGPSATQMTGILGNVGGSPLPDGASSVNLTPWSPGGFGSIAPLPLPQLQDTSAAFLTPPDLAPPTPLYDPDPPQLTMDQLAMMYGMSPDQVAATREGAEQEVEAQHLTGEVLVPAIEWTVPEFGAFMVGKKLVTGGLDVLNSLGAAQEPQEAANAGDQAIFKSLNDAEFQSIPSAARTWIP
jgi:hypothetical protein